MAAQIDSFPDKIRPDNQPLIFTISDGVSTPDRYIVQVEEDGTEIAKLYLTPNTAGVVHFDLSEIVRDRVKVDDKERDESDTIHIQKATAFTTGRNGLKQYEVKVGTYDGTSESLDDDNESVYLVDGSEQIIDGLHPFFKSFYPTVTSAISWLTDRRSVSQVLEVKADDDDFGVGAFLNDSTIIGGTATKVAYELYQGGTMVSSEDFDIDVANGAQLPGATDINQKITYMGIFPQNLKGYVQSGSRPSDFPDWTHYNLRLETAAGVTRSSTIKVVKECDPFKHDLTQLAWTNSNGGWDYLKFEGRTLKTLKTESKMYKKALGDWDDTTYTFIKQARDSQPYQVVGMQSYELKSVNFTTNELELLQYALRSDNAMVRIGAKGVWFPVNLDTKTYKVETSVSRITSVSFNVTQAQAIRC